MTETLQLLQTGFSTAFSLQALFSMSFGVILGSVFGAMPGLSATTGMALMLPIVFKMDLAIGLLMLAGIYCGALYGGAISPPLLGISWAGAGAPPPFFG